MPAVRLATTTGMDVSKRLSYAVWKAMFGSTTNLDADGNHNGVVDAGDYTIWRDHLGEGILGAGSLASVPEPTTMWIIVTGAMCAGRWFRAQTHPRG